MMMALNAETENDVGSERRTENVDGSKRRSWETMMELNAELKTNNGSERQTRDTALNAKLEIRLWTPN